MKALAKEEKKEWLIKEQGYRKKILLDEKGIGVNGAVFQIVEFPVGVKIKPHFHKKQTEVFYVLEGEAMLCIGGECTKAKPGMTFLCKPGEKHSVENEGNNAFRMIVVKWNEPKELDYFEEE